MKKLMIGLAMMTTASLGAEPERTQEQGGDGQVIYRAGSQDSFEGPAEYFTGHVHVDLLFPANEHAPFSGAYVTFQPGARSAWHLHPAGQHIIVTSGAGLTGTRDGKAIEIRAGDTVWCPPGVEHWHGAAPGAAMTHLVITGDREGENVVWKEKVTDEEYGNRAEAKTAAPLSADLLEKVSPALAKYQAEIIETRLAERDFLSRRDRSIITVAAMIARNQTADMSRQINLALANGVTPAEISETITHLAFYAGWDNAIAAAAIVQTVFAQQGTDAGELPVANPELLPLNEDAEAQRAAFVEREWGDTAPGVVEFTEDVLFRDLWLRPALNPRDRSLITVSALVASGHVEQIPFHLNRAMDSGLTQSEASEILTHLAFYAGWPNIFSAMPVVRDVLRERNP